MPEADHILAHKHSIRHRQEIITSKTCGCFFCGAIFLPSDVEVWVDDEGCDDDEGKVGQTALCPQCGIDSVIGSRSGYLISADFLSRMRKQWFW
jgi:hypothetical protein